jgi:hypothetical protein
MKKIQMKTLLEKVKKVNVLYLTLVILAAVALTSLYKTNAASTDDAAQATFASPEEAGKALRTAALNDDEAALMKILGADSKEVLSSGDAEIDRAEWQDFALKFDLMNRWVKMTDGSEILNIGADNFAFPIPLVQSSSSKWCFDTEAGKEEILARRIGRQELLAIDAVYAIADAEEAYAKTPHDGNPAGLYTAKIFSTAGKQDGLYWPTAEGEAPSPLGRVDLFAKDALSTSNESPVIDGYSFRILAAQGPSAKGGAKEFMVNGKLTGGFAVIASPVKYGESGIMTFIISREGVVYQMDLGDDTAVIAKMIKTYNPTPEWEPAE